MAGSTFESNGCSTSFVESLWRERGREYVRDLRIDKGLRKVKAEAGSIPVYDEADVATKPKVARNAGNALRFLGGAGVTLDRGVGIDY